MKQRLLSPTNDIAFKKIFGTQEHRPLLISFLNAVLELEGPRKIKHVTIRSKDLIVDLPLQKECFLDILVRDEEKNSYIVEVQVEKEPGFLKRVQHYAAKVYSQELGKSQLYDSLRKVVTLVVAKHILFPDCAHYKSMHEMIDKKCGVNHLEEFNYVFVELPKFKKKIEQLENIEDQWCYFLKNASYSTVEDERRMVEKFPETEEAFRTLVEHSWDPMELHFYEKKERDEAQHGLALVIAKNQGERENKLQIAKNMIEEGLPLSLISKVTKLGFDEIQELFNPKK